MTNPNDHILALVESGLSIIPIAEGKKIPHYICLDTNKKHDLLTRRSTREEAEKWLAAGVSSWALAGGAVSGNLMTLDFDEKHYPGLYDLWYAKLADDQKAIVDTCPRSHTRNNGTHLRYRTETSQPTVKLSSRVISEKIETTSETKAEGGYALIPPSAGYTMVQGDLAHLPLVPDEIHEELIDILRTFNEVEDEPATEYEWKPGEVVTGDRPGDRFNKLANWNEVLEPHGWMEETPHHWRRPGKKEGEGISATTDHNGIPMIYVFSTTAAPFTANKGVSKFHAFALLNHGGDFKAAARAAAEKYPSEDSDWEETYNTDALKGLGHLSATTMATKLLRDMPREMWPIGLELFIRWNSLIVKPSKTSDVKRTWSNAVKAEELSRKKKAKEGVKAEPRVRIAKCPTPEKPVMFSEWGDIINSNFPDLRFAAEVALSTVSQFLIKDITNPFALVLVDVPSSGKTICINFFADIPELTYATDKFTPASFVSNAANVAKDKLAEIDLLPRIQYRMFLIRDFATLFSKREDDLNELLGILTRVLDGEGLNTDSGVHGQREYNGEYLFMILAASTPIAPKVMKVMGNLGSRLFFLSINSRDKSEGELAAQVADLSYKEKETLCRTATRNFLYGLWNTYPQGLVWDKSADDKELLTIIARCAKLLAHLRGVINVWQDNRDNSEFKYATPVIEKPDRLNQLFYNLARGHALVSGRTQIAMDDLKAVIELCIDGAPTGRAMLFRKLIEHGGEMSTSDVENDMNCSKPTALKEMKTLEILKVCGHYENSIDDNEIHLIDDFRWFLSDECRAIQGLPAIKARIADEEAIKQF